MRNNGEESIYWYLRLNGFFVIDDFVLHSSKNVSASDVDLLAVRFPYFSEQIEDVKVKCDPKLLNYFDEKSIIGLICEVKTGRDRNANSLLNRAHIVKSLNRIGFKKYSDNEIDRIVSSNVSSENNNDIFDPKYQIGKVLFSNKIRSTNDEFIDFKLKDAKQFIIDRMTEFKNSKYRDRMFFPTGYVQYILDDIKSTDK